MKTDKLKKVLIALDYHKSALKVAETGYALAKSMNAEVTLLHIISDPLYYASVENMPIMGLTDSLGTNPLQFDPDNRLKEVSQHFLDKIKLHFEDDSINTVLKEGEFAETILNTANELHADIIVLGSHSRKWLDDILLGSVTNQVLRQTHRPLFIVPTKKQD